LRVGALEETLTVSGQAPVVDVQNTSQVKTVSAEMLFALPITKEMGGLAKVTVGVMIPPTAQDVGGNIDPMNAYPVIHGGRTNDNRALLDGMQFNGEGQGRGFYFNPSAAQEASVQLGGQTAEFENGGFQANMIPKDGGNIFSGIFSTNYAGKGLVSDNLSQGLRDRGLTLVNKAQRTYDGNIAVGGPIPHPGAGELHRAVPQPVHGEVAPQVERAGRGDGRGHADDPSLRRGPRAPAPRRGPGRARRPPAAPRPR